jgi:hypothetical protein
MLLGILSKQFKAFACKINIDANNDAEKIKLLRPGMNGMLMYI